MKRHFSKWAIFWDSSKRGLHRVLCISSLIGGEHRVHSLFSIKSKTFFLWLVFLECKCGNSEKIAVSPVLNCCWCSKLQYNSVLWSTNTEETEPIYFLWLSLKLCVCVCVCEYLKTRKGFFTWEDATDCFPCLLYRIHNPLMPPLVQSGNQTVQWRLFSTSILLGSNVPLSRLVARETFVKSDNCVLH